VIVPEPFSAEQQRISTSDSHTVPLLLSEINSLAIRLRQRGRSTAITPGELPGAEHAVLEIIDRRGPLTVPQIACERSTSRQNIQILIDRLAARGQIEFSSNPAHKRSALVRLTQRGNALLEAGVSNQSQLLTQLGSCLSSSEISATVAVLRKLSGLLSGEPKNGQNGNLPPQANKRSEPKKEIAAAQEIADEQTVAEEFPVNLL